MIIEDNSVRGSQVYTQTTRTSTKQEYEDIRPAITLRIGQTNMMPKDTPSLPVHNHIPSVFQLRRTIQANILVLTVDQVFLH